MVSESEIISIQPLSPDASSTSPAHNANGPTEGTAVNASEDSRPSLQCLTDKKKSLADEMRRMKQKMKPVEAQMKNLNDEYINMGIAYVKLQDAVDEEIKRLR
jgi:predicted  nucleic acid-binding Zn-ribbon protein